MDFGFVDIMPPKGMAQCEEFSQFTQITKFVALTNETRHVKAKEIYHIISAKLDEDCDKRTVGDDRIAIQIAELLCEEDIPSDWMFSMRAWHIT